MQEERGFYNWLIKAMIEALDIEIQGIKEAIKFWSTREPTGDKEFDEKMQKGDRELVDLNLKSLRDVEHAKALLAPLVGKMPRHHIDRAYLAILKGLEGEVREYRLRMSWIVSCDEKISDRHDTDLRMALLAAGELEQAVSQAVACAGDLVHANKLRRTGGQESKKGG